MTPAQLAQIEARLTAAGSVPVWKLGERYEGDVKELLAEVRRLQEAPSDIGFQAYQVIGYLDEVIYGAGTKASSEEMIRAMDYFSSGVYDETFLPWPRAAGETTSP